MSTETLETRVANRISALAANRDGSPGDTCPLSVGEVTGIVRDEVSAALEKSKHGHRGLVGELENTRVRLGLAEKRVAELEGARETKTWRCFHCDEVFDNEKKALEHFGPTEVELEHAGIGTAGPVCQLKLEDVQQMEYELARYRAEDSDLDRKYRAMEADHQVALRREEEKGYARGLRDAAKENEAARAKAIGKPSAWFARDEEWLRELSCEIAGQDISATVDAVGYAMDELDRRADVIAAQEEQLDVARLGFVKATKEAVAMRAELGRLRKFAVQAGEAALASGDDVRVRLTSALVNLNRSPAQAEPHPERTPR